MITKVEEKHTPGLGIPTRLEEQVHSLCVDSRPGDRSFFAKGPPSSSPVKHSLKLTARLRRWPEKKGTD